METGESYDTDGLCMKCYNPNGKHKLLLTRIPHFKDVVVQYFECPKCLWTNSEILDVAALNPKGRRISVCIKDKLDLNRQIVKANFATLKFMPLDFEIPSDTQKGIVTTIEGVLTQAWTALEADQPQRRLTDATVADKIQNCINSLKLMSEGHTDHMPFDAILDDPSGNSFIEPIGQTLRELDGVKLDGNMSLILYDRTIDQLRVMGHYGTDEIPADTTQGQQDNVKTIDTPTPSTTTNILESICIHSNDTKSEEGYDRQQAMVFDTPCGHCRQIGSTNMCEIDIPGFRKCILMSFVCEKCGAKSSEVKPSGTYGSQGRKWTLRVEDVSDLSRDLLKSDTASFMIPEIDFEATSGSHGGLFTTVEGLILACSNNLEGDNPFIIGDSTKDVEARSNLRDVINKLKMFAAGEALPFTLIIDDPADHSYIGILNPTLQIDSSMVEAKLNTAGQNKDYRLTQILYDRTDEQNDELGINDMKTEDY